MRLLSIKYKKLLSNPFHKSCIVGNAVLFEHIQRAFDDVQTTITTIPQ